MKMCDLKTTILSQQLNPASKISSNLLLDSREIAADISFKVEENTVENN